MEDFLHFNHLFVGIGNNGSRIVKNLNIRNAGRVVVDPADYILNRKELIRDIRRFFGELNDNTIAWFLFENKPINIEISKQIDYYTPGKVIKLAYVLTPHTELVEMNKPEWADMFETVFYDSLRELLKEYQEIPLKDAFEMASRYIGGMFSKLYYYLENDMLINVDYADLFAIIKGRNVGILRILNKVEFDWNWGIWERGLINIRAGRHVPLSKAHSILNRFQYLLSKKDVIWGVQIDEETEKDIEILALLVKRW